MKDGVEYNVIGLYREDVVRMWVCEKRMKLANDKIIRREHKNNENELTELSLHKLNTLYFVCLFECRTKRIVWRGTHFTMAES
jgi:hypothetical protein